MSQETLKPVVLLTITITHKADFEGVKVLEIKLQKNTFINLASAMKSRKDINDLSVTYCGLLVRKGSSDVDSGGVIISVSMEQIPLLVRSYCL